MLGSALKLTSFGWKTSMPRFSHKWGTGTLFSLLSYPSLVAQRLEHLHGKWKVLGSIPRLGKHFSPKYDCSLHQEQSLLGSALKITNFNVQLENFYAPGHLWGLIFGVTDDPELDKNVQIRIRRIHIFTFIHDDIITNDTPVTNEGIILWCH